MRYGPKDKQKTRQRIIRTASRRYRAEGLSAVGIAKLMADLGMTHGGFYAHFVDKEALVAEACSQGFAELIHHWDKQQELHPQQDALVTLIQDYLSLQHRNHPDTGCIAAALSGEMAHRDHRSRKAFTSGLQQMLDYLAARLPAGKIKPEAVLGLMVGSMMLARAVSDPAMSERLLDCARSAILGQATT